MIARCKPRARAAEGEATTIIRIPGLRLTGGGNSREHPMARKRRVAEEHRLVTLSLNARLRRSEIVFPLRVTVTSVSAGTKDRDNASSACKNVIDAVAAWLGVDDGKAERAGIIEWKPGQQRKGTRGFFATEIEIETVDLGWSAERVAELFERARAVPKVARQKRRTSKATASVAGRALGRAAPYKPATGLVARMAGGVRNDPVGSKGAGR